MFIRLKQALVTLWQVWIGPSAHSVRNYVNAADLLKALATFVVVLGVVQHTLEALPGGIIPATVLTGVQIALSAVIGLFDLVRRLRQGAPLSVVQQADAVIGPSPAGLPSVPAAPPVAADTSPPVA